MYACRNLASEKAELAEMVQQLEGKLAVASGESKEAAKAMKQLQEELEASHTDRSASHHLATLCFLEGPLRADFAEGL